MKTATDKLTQLKEIIARYETVAIAFSGGVDSTLLLQTAWHVLGDNAIAFLARSPFQIPSEIAGALQTAKEIGCRLITVDFDLASDDTFCENRADRCYYCKKLIYTAFQEKMSQFGCQVLMDGTNLDDAQQDRPGALAIKELGVVTPLKDALLTKKEIRQISRNLALPTWNKFSASCLATRIEHGKRIRLEDVSTVTEIENRLISEGFLGSRLKIQNNCAIVSLAQGNHSRFITSSIRDEIQLIIKSKGFSQLFLDLSEREGILT